MKFLHHEAVLGDGDAVEVTLDTQANVRLLDDANYAKFKEGEKHTFYGGWVETSPVILDAPEPGHWHVVIDLGGAVGTVSASVSVLKTTRVD